MESRIRGDVYVRFGGRLVETYLRKEARRHGSSLRHADPKRRETATRISSKVLGKEKKAK